ncbi:MAG TPA: DNA-directed RNA polymerase subunit alpha [Tissierellia bacterium]|jgi:DNA-directed RNA polymerase subunit alpha|nr:DNA-directed RNA polymerase subunit alpha [Tissierellia bacterium]
MLGIEKPNLTFSEFDERKNYLKLTVEPLERGYGMTLGNSLRRIMLSSLPGCAVKWVKFDDVLHEFSTIDGVQEDVVDIILNIKGLVANIHSEEVEKILRIDVSKSQVITAGDIIADSDVEIVNPDLYIASLTENKPFYMEMCLTRGRGYVSAEENKLDIEDTLSVIAVDSVFTPVTRANFTVEPTRVGKSSNYDRLIHEVWTDGSIRPEEAISMAAKVLNDHLDLYIQLTDSVEHMEVLYERESETKERAMEMTVEELELTQRSRNCLKRAGINTIEELVSKTEDDLMKVRNLGKKSLAEIKEKLAEMNFSLRSTEE